MSVGQDYRLESITSSNGLVITLTYNTDGLLDKIIDGTREISFGYDPSTLDLVSITKPTTTQYPLGTSKTFLYNSDRKVVSVTDAKGQTFVNNQYGTSGRVIKREVFTKGLRVGEPTSYVTTYSYTLGLRVTETFPKGNGVIYSATVLKFK